MIGNPVPGHTRLLGRVAAVVCAGWLVACAHPAPPFTPDEGEPVTNVYIASNGWHTAVVLARHDLPPGRVPEAADFPDAVFLEFGWGDREYFPAPRPTLDMVLAAALAPTPSVMHLAGLDRPPNEVYPEAEVLAVPLSVATLDRLVARIDASFDRPEGGRAETVARGLYHDSRFYPAHGRFHLFNTCNTWTARNLADAGVGVSPTGVVRAEDLMRRLRELPNVRRLSQTAIEDRKPGS
jgi:uncharacterized protein (TIGR02117 family)